MQSLEVSGAVRPIYGLLGVKRLRHKIKKISPITSQRSPEGSRKLRFPDYVTMAQDGGKVVSPRHRPLFTPRKYSWYSFLLEAESAPGPQCGRKDYVDEELMIPSRIEPETFRCVAQRLNHCATAVPKIKIYRL